VRAAKFGEGFGGFVEEIVWSDILGEEQDNFETYLPDLYKRLFGAKLRNEGVEVWRGIWRICRGECLE
jgi:hypothetical protein